MGLINSLTREAEDVARRADVQEQFAQRRVANYNKDVTAKTAEMAPHQKIISDFNTIVDQYNSGWIDPYYWNGSPGGSGLTAFYDPSRKGGDMLGLGTPPAGNKIYAGPNPIPGVGGTLYRYNKHPTPDTTIPKASDAFLTSQKSTIDALNIRGENVQARNERAQINAEREVERLDTSIAHNKPAIQDEQQGPQQTSVFAQNSQFQSIFDWLKA